MKGEFLQTDEQLKLLDELRQPSIEWSTDLAERGGPLLSVSDEVPEFEGSTVYLSPKPMSEAELKFYDDNFFEPGAGLAEMADGLERTGIIDSIQEKLDAGETILVASNHSTHIDPAVIGNVLYRSMGEADKLAIMVNIAMDYLEFAGTRIPDMLRKTGHVVKTVPDTQKGLKYIPAHLRQVIIPQAGRATKELKRNGLVMILNPSGTIDKIGADDENRRKMHTVTDGTVSLIRGFNYLLPMALEVSQPNGKFRVDYIAGELVEIPNGKHHPKNDTRVFLHDTMETIAHWNTQLTGGKPEVYYEFPESAAKKIGVTALENVVNPRA